MSAVLAEIKDIHNASTRLPYKMATEDERSCQNITVWTKIANLKPLQLAWSRLNWMC